MQNISICGTVGRVEFKPDEGRGATLRLSVAVNSRVRSASGEWTDHPTWYSVSVYGKRAESLSKILDKGYRVATSGELSVKHTGEKLWLNVNANEVSIAYKPQRDFARKDEMDPDPTAEPQSQSPTSDNLPF